MGAGPLAVHGRCLELAFQTMQPKKVVGGFSHHITNHTEQLRQLGMDQCSGL